ncbi:hypothetical protein LSH36_395g00001 [Paralvinella palmiformis]|uniref:Uncharacterized protein n=1 Tax=Paralvinella palmiformis TaxID=53620 RepID=A0AAD9MYP0_9ANNE|nr:hypothetical protein LSH36_395g00001 [Paralvinella palmiformis]
MEVCTGDTIAISMRREDICTTTGSCRRIGGGIERHLAGPPIGGNVQRQQHLVTANNLSRTDQAKYHLPCTSATHHCLPGVRLSSMPLRTVSGPFMPQYGRVSRTREQNVKMAAFCYTAGRPTVESQMSFGDQVNGRAEAPLRLCYKASESPLIGGWCVWAVGLAYGPLGWSNGLPRLE